MIVSSPSPNVSAAFTATFISTAATSDFAVGDITVTNATKSSFVTVNSTTYTCLITPSTSGAVTVSVAGASFTSSGYANQTSNTLTVTYSTGGVPARFYIIGGQSNVVPGGTSVSSFPTELRAVIPRSYIWDNVNNVFNPLHAGFNGIGAWPIIKFAYDLSVRYPNEELYFVQNGLSGYSMYYHWHRNGDSYNQTLGYFNTAIATLSDRDFLEKTFWFIQGESDCVALQYANAYQGYLADFVTGARADFGVSKFIDNNIYVNIPSSGSPGLSTVRTAKANVDAGDANFFLANSDAWSFQADNVHLSTTGVQSAGAYAASV